jgi:hypothetical protein
MEDWGLALAVLAPILAGVGSFLFNDGRDHKLVGLIGEGIGWASFGILGLAQQQQQADDQVDCSLYGRSCPDFSGGLLPWLWDVLFKGMALEWAMMIGSISAGWFLAKLTRRRRADGRSAVIFPPED